MDTARKESEIQLNIAPEKERWSTIALEGHGCIQLWSTIALFNWINKNSKHPLLERELDPAEIAYIEHYNQCNKCRAQCCTENSIYKKFTSLEGNLDGDDLLMARAILEPMHFARHFKNYEPLENNIKYERAQAEAYLQQSITNCWLIRYSSLNRDLVNQELITKLGLQYYVISYTVSNTMIKHILIMHRPGWGWAKITNVSYTTFSVIPTNSKKIKYKVCFIDILLKIIRKLDLQFVNQIYGYMLL